MICIAYINLLRVCSKYTLSDIKFCSLKSRTCVTYLYNEPTNAVL